MIGRMNRSQLRENIFKLLYLSGFNREDEMEGQMSLYFEGQDVAPAEKDKAYIETKYAKVKEYLEEIDRMLNETSEGWKTSRMGKVDLAILRLAVYEMFFDEDVPVSVAINEAVELGKRFGTDDSSSFINGILGKLAKKADA